MTRPNEIAVPLQLENSAQLEHRLATTMRDVALRITQRDDILRALNAAEQLKQGLVIADDTQASAIADLVVQVIDGQKTLEKETRDALRIPKQMEVAVRTTVKGTADLLHHARQAANDAQVAYKGRLRREAADREAKARQEAQEAAQRAAEEAAVTGEDAPPALEVAPVEVPRVIQGGTAKVGTQIRIEVDRVEAWLSVPQEWLRLDAVVARGEFLASGMAKPEPGKSVIWRGVRFRSVESVVVRR
jgi:hypothetical protein